MKAIVCTEYGTADVLRLEDIDKPVPQDDELLIKIEATSLNATDMELLAGKPFYIRLGGLRAPMVRILGTDMAGRVEAVGRDVTDFKAGDVVFGDLSQAGFGALAEYVCAPQEAVALKPDGVSMDDAAAVPQAGVLALQGLRSNGGVQPGHKVLINGAGGGAGTFAVQLAKLFGAEVTGVDHGSKLNMVRSIGADHVIDYTHEDFTRNGQRYDLILDTVAQRSMPAYRRALTPEGSFAMIGGSTGVMLQAVTLGTWYSRRSEQNLGLVMHRQSTADLLYLAELVQTGQITPVIGGRYPLSETSEAFRQLIAGRAFGKLVIRIGDGPQPDRPALTGNESGA